MKIKWICILVLPVLLLIFGAFRTNERDAYTELYQLQYKKFDDKLKELKTINSSDTLALHEWIAEMRLNLKNLDFWWRYTDPIQYKFINGPLPVEWETEVFEKYEPPYKRIGYGLTLAEQALDEGDHAYALQLLQPVEAAIEHFRPDSMRLFLESADHFAHCNRLYLLNLAAIYTTGFECPDTAKILPELKSMLTSVRSVYEAYNRSFPEKQLSTYYIQQYDDMIQFVQSNKYWSNFNHFEFLSTYVNPLYGINSRWMQEKNFRSKSNMDYALNKKAESIFDKSIYFAQNTKGIFHRVTDAAALNKIEELGKLLFHDPILSGNNERSCASCHKLGEYFADTGFATAERFDHKGRLSRNTPSTINAEYNHLIMQDGRFISLQQQALAVMINPEEMGAKQDEILKMVMSCKTYKKLLNELAQLTPQLNSPDLEHIISALTYYYSKFSRYRSRFDLAIERQAILSIEEIRGFNLFMSKAQCATCHFVPHFNGVKPPYIGSEFEVLGVPDDTGFSLFGKDSGRYVVNPARETMFAFRTGNLKNISRTAPYMHNGVFRTLSEVIEFYNNGGAQGRGLKLENQTLSGEKLGLNKQEIADLVAFLKSLDENIQLEEAPKELPVSSIKKIKIRQVGGVY